MIYIASDHGGFKLKEYLKKTLGNKVRFIDLGPTKFVNGDDYPDYAKKVAAKISSSLPSRAKSRDLSRGMEDSGNIGILICRSGQGVCIAANKFKRVRAALVWNTKEAKASRNDDMANVLCLPSDYVTRSTAVAIVKTFLTTPFSKNKRHIRRVKKIAALEI